MRCVPSQRFILSGSQPGDVNPEEFLTSQTTSLLTDGNAVEGWGMSDDLEPKTAGETAVIPQWSLQVLFHPFGVLTFVFLGPAAT